MREASTFFVRRHSPKAKTCFVLMPFDEALTAVYEHGIKPLVESMGMTCRRADELYSAQGILGDIWDSIQLAEIVIADLTNKNPNVMYELGLCHSLWKRVILLAQNRDDVPFDLRAWRVLWYDFSFPGAARLKDELKRAIEAMQSEDPTESELVPHSPAATSTPRRPQEDAAKDRDWIRGIVDTWRTNEHGFFGFIRNSDGDFYFNPDYMFTPIEDVERGRRALFIEQEPLGPGKGPRASKVFIIGSVVRVRITKVHAIKGYGFGECEGANGEMHTLLVLPMDGASITQGVTVDCEIDENEKGPIARALPSTSE